MTSRVKACLRLLSAGLGVLLVAPVQARLVNLTILHTTDLHGHVLPSYTYDGKEHVGGFLRCASYIDAVKRESPNTLYLDCGDLTQGGIESYLSEGAVITRALELAGCDAWVIGNHEFDRGVESLVGLLEKTTLTRLGANFSVRPGSPPLLPGLKPYEMFNVDGLRVAVIGLTTPGIPYWSRPFLLKQLRVAGSVESLQALWPQIKAEDPDLIILAAHQGLRPQGDDFANEIGAIAREFPDIDLILGGHSHRVVELETIHNIPYAQAGYHANWVGRVDIAYDTVKDDVVGLTSVAVEMGTDYPQAHDLLGELKPQLDKAKAYGAEVIGTLASSLGGRSPVPGHSAQQQLICDAIQDATDCDFVIHGAFSDMIFPPGPVTHTMLWRMIPYENRIGILQVTKDDIIAILEENATNPKSFYFMGNTGFTYDLRTYAPVGERVANLRLATGEPLHPRKRYRLALNSYVLASGGQRYRQTRRIADQPISRLEWINDQTRGLVRAYLKKHPALEMHSVPGLTVVRREKAAP